jgi:hypothetical protein
MSGYIGTLEGGGSVYVGEHTCRRVLAGDLESARERLVYALERLDYTVLSEQPIQAKRVARKGSLSADFLDYARRLNVALRPQSDAATLVTFDFAVTHNGLMTRGDRQTLERESDAIHALAAARPAPTLCASCGTENTADSRFCRLCGTPNAVGEPAELEVMRLTAGARGSLQEIFMGLLVVTLVAALFLPLVLFGGAKAAKAGWIFFVVGQVVGWLTLAYGTLRLHRTLNPKEERPKLAPAAAHAPAPPLPTHARERALPPRTARASVTEATTDLLSDDPREPIPLPLRRKGDTDPMLRS